MGRSSNVSSSIDSNSVLLISKGSSWPYGCIPTSIIASVSDEVFNKGGGPAGGRGCCTSSTGLGTSRTTTSPKTSRELFEAGETQFDTFLSASQQVCAAAAVAHPTVYSGDPRLGQQCVAGRPLCLFGARLSSCSSTGAGDFVVGSTDCATSVGTTLS